MSGIRTITRRPTVPGFATDSSAPIYVDSDDNALRMITGGGGSVTEVELVPNALFATITGDGAIPLVPGITQLTKGSAAAITVAAPGVAMIGKKITIIAGSNFAHVVTFTGSTLRTGTAASASWTSAALIGSSLTVVGLTATTWGVVNFNLGTFA